MIATHACAKPAYLPPTLTRKPTRSVVSAACHRATIGSLDRVYRNILTRTEAHVRTAFLRVLGGRVHGLLRTRLPVGHLPNRSLCRERHSNSGSAIISLARP